MQLEAWQEAHRFAVMIYKLTRTFPKEETFGLTSQIRRAAVSVSSNIAEGFGRTSVKEKLRFYDTAHASILETQNQLLLARDVGIMEATEFQKLAHQSTRVAKLLHGLMRKIKNELRTTNYELRNNSSKTERGSVLLELLLTVGSIVVVLLVLLLAMLSATQLQLRAERQAIASQLASQQIEILRGRSVASLVNQTDGSLLGSPEPSLANLPAGLATLTIRDYDNNPSLKEATVTVSFAEGSRRVSLVFSTLIGAGGLNG